jgi:hypothetical protein
MGGAVPPRTKPSSGGIIDGNADSLTIWPCSKGPFRIPTNPANAGAPARTASGSNDATSGVAVHLRHLLPNPERCGGVTEPSGEASPTAHPQGAR